MKLKVMTFNLRVRAKVDGDNILDNRQGKILDVIRRESPDLIGFQEVGDDTLAWLKESLPDYYVLGHGRLENCHGEGSPIAYRRDLFDLHSFREEWLSFTPNKPASRLVGLDQSPYPRVCLCAELIPTGEGEPIAFFNMHTDHRGETARLIECSMLAERLFASPYRFVVTGDFNALPDSTSIGVLLATAEDLGTVDATREIVGSSHGFRGDVGKRKIDYVFTNLPTDPAASYAVPDDNACGYFYSDHAALCAFVEI